jgi:prepilin-type N-terminal cleavage/methylation domain-containing protein
LPAGFRHPPAARRAGFTLLEVMLAMSIGVLLLGGLYVAVDLQLRHAQAGRDLVVQTYLSREILSRMSADIRSTVNLPNAARFSSPNAYSKNSSSGGSGGGGGSGGSGGGAASATAAGATGASTNTGNTGSTSAQTTTGGTNDAITYPFGIQGDSGTINLYISKVPSEVLVPVGSDVPPPVSDVRRISYWLAAGGLAKQEVKIITSQDVTNLIPPDLPDDAYQIVAEEVRSLTFQYFDGSSWQDTWDSTILGLDGKTPIGPPRAVAIVIGLTQFGSTDDSNLVYHRHVVPITTANGTSINSAGTVTDYGIVGGTWTTSAGTTTTSSGGGTSP